MRKIYFLFIAIALLSSCSKESEPSFNLETYEGRVAYFEYDNQNNPDCDFCMVGDSLTQYYDLNKYFPNKSTKNRGIAGDSTTSLLNRLDKSIRGMNPKITILLIGANNVSTFQNDYELLVQKTMEYLPNTELYLCSITPTCGAYQGYMSQIKENNVYIQSIVTKHSLYYLDLYSSLIDNETNLLRESYTVEGQHFNENGYLKITEQIQTIFFLAKSYLRYKNKVSASNIIKKDL